MQQDTINPNRLARSLQGALKDLGVNIKLGTAMEAVAKITGNSNWRTIAALRKHGRLDAPADAADTQRKPRVLVTVYDGLADYVCDQGVDVHVFDRNGFEQDPCDDYVAPERFADLAEPIDVPFDHGKHNLAEAPKSVQDAFAYVRSVFPGVTQVRYDTELRWSYQDAQGTPVKFSSQIDVALLELAADELDVVPITYCATQAADAGSQPGQDGADDAEDSADYVVHGMRVVGPGDDGREIVQVDEIHPTFWALYRAREDGTEDWVEDFTSREAAMSALAAKTGLREQFATMYAYQDAVSTHPVAQDVLACIHEAVQAMEGVDGIRFRTNLTDRANPANAAYFAHDGQPIVAFLPPVLRSVESDSICDEEVLPYYRVRFADGQILQVDDTEMIGIDVRLGHLIDTVSGAFALARDLGYAGVWDLIAHGRAKQLADFEAAYARHNESHRAMHLLLDEAKAFAQVIWSTLCMEQAMDEAAETGDNVQDLLLAGAHPEKFDDLDALRRAVARNPVLRQHASYARVAKEEGFAEKVYAFYRTAA